jgi:type III pantothenate kinase
VLIVFDVGNSETTVGLFDGTQLVAHWRVTTDVGRTSDEFGLLLLGLLQSVGVAAAQVSASDRCRKRACAISRRRR